MCSFGASSYLILRPEGNVMVDRRVRRGTRAHATSPLTRHPSCAAVRSPRFAAPLVRQLEEWGGVQGIFLTHQARPSRTCHE